jgi:hypothetical protein
MLFTLASLAVLGENELSFHAGLHDRQALTTPKKSSACCHPSSFKDLLSEREPIPNRSFFLQSEASYRLSFLTSAAVLNDLAQTNKNHVSAGLFSCQVVFYTQCLIITLDMLAPFKHETLFHLSKSTCVPNPFGKELVSSRTPCSPRLTFRMINWLKTTSSHT